MIDRFTPTIASAPEGPPVTTLPLRTWARNAAAVFSRSYGAIARRAEQAGCSRQAVSEHARQTRRRSEPEAPAAPAVEVPIPAPTPAAVIDAPTRGRLAVTACAMGISTRQIADLLRVIPPEEGPDHSTIGRWVAEQAAKAEGVLQTLDTARASRIGALALDEIFSGGGRPRSRSSRRA